MFKFVNSGPHLVASSEAEVVVAADVRVGAPGLVGLRVAQFATARQCARDALSQLGVLSALPDKKIGECPIWPSGVVGSIAHAGSICVAIASTDPHISGLGVDVEALHEDGRRLPPRIFHESELHLPELLGLSLGVRQRLVLAIKEAVFKALFPREGWTAHRDTVVIDIDRSHFIARVRGVCDCICGVLRLHKSMLGVVCTRGSQCNCSGWTSALSALNTRSLGDCLRLVPALK